MSLQSALTTVALLITILSAVCGAAWWMGALFSRVKAIQERLESFTAESHEEIRQLAKSDSVLDRRVDEHDQRLSVIEIKLE